MEGVLPATLNGKTACLGMMMFNAKMAVGGLLMVLAVIAAAIISNRVLDSAGIANGPGLTVQERKDKAKRNQFQYDHRFEVETDE